MRATCLQENLSRGLKILDKVVPKGKALTPETQDILLSASSGHLVLKRTDLSFSITAWIDATNVEDGDISVPHQYFSDVVSSFSRDKVELLEVNNSLVAKCGPSKASFRISKPALPGDVSLKGDQTTILLPTKLLREGLGVSFAAAKETTRPILQGVLLGMRGKRVRFAATDGFRLAVHDLALPNEVDVELRVLIPERVTKILQPVLIDFEDNVLITLGKNTVTFQLPYLQFSSSLTAGEFIKYESVIPKTSTCTFTVDRLDLVQATKGAVTLPLENKTVRIMCRPGMPGEVKLSSASQEIGEYESLLEANVQGEGRVALNGEYLIESLQALGGDKVTVGMTKSTYPLLLDNKKGMQVVMLPVAVSNL